MAPSANFSSQAASFMPPAFRGKISTLAAAVAVWVTLLAAGIYEIATYETTPGSSRNAPLVWPKESALLSSTGKWTAVMFLHPQCPCSRASLEEFNVILNQAPGRVKPYVVFIQPRDQDATWTQTRSWDQAGRMSGAQRVVDLAGAEAGRFGARTSGFLVVYDPSGHLRFSGGVTDARGEVGDNVGRDSVLALIQGRNPMVHDHAVFGCALQ